MKQHINILYSSHLGCPHICVFCVSAQLPAGVASDIERQISGRLSQSKTAPTADRLFGGALPVSEPRQLLGIAARFVEEGRASGIRLSTRPDYIDLQTLSILAEYPVKTVELGIQSMDNKVLRMSKRGHTAEQSSEACRLVVKHGFSLVGQMMIGLPGADERSEIKTAEDICALGATGARIYPTVVLKNTELEEMSRDGRYLPLSLDEAIGRSASVLEIFIAYGVPVIRLGLCASDGLSLEGAVGGAYHPAMGELVRGELTEERSAELVAGSPTETR